MLKHKFKIEAIPNLGMTFNEGGEEKSTIFPFFTIDGVLAHYSFVTNGIYNTPLGMIKEDVFTNLVGKENLHLVLIKEDTKEKMMESVLDCFNRRFTERRPQPYTEAVLFLLETTNNALDCVFYNAFNIKAAKPVLIEETTLKITEPYVAVSFG